MKHVVAADDNKKLETLRQEVARIAKTIHGDVGASVAILGESPIPLINGDPLKDIAILIKSEENIALIMKDGKIYKNTVK